MKPSPKKHLKNHSCCWIFSCTNWRVVCNFNYTMIFCFLIDCMFCRVNLVRGISLHKFPDQKEKKHLHKKWAVELRMKKVNKNAVVSSEPLTNEDCLKGGILSLSYFTNIEKMFRFYNSIPFNNRSIKTSDDVINGLF